MLRAATSFRNAAVLCALKKSDDPNTSHKPSSYMYYVLHHYTQPNMVIDIYAVYVQKLDLLRIHAS